MARPAKPDSDMYRGWSEQRIEKHRKRTLAAMKKKYKTDKEFRERAKKRAKECYENQTEEEREHLRKNQREKTKHRYATDKEFKQRAKKTSDRYMKKLKKDPIRLALLKEKRRAYYIAHKEEIALKRKLKREEKKKHK